MLPYLKKTDVEILTSLYSTKNPDKSAIELLGLYSVYTGFFSYTQK